MMASPLSLTGLHILVTRPEPNTTILCKLLQDHGAHTYPWPTIDIRPIPFHDHPVLNDITPKTLCVFVSQSAVTHFFSGNNNHHSNISSAQTMLRSNTVIAMGHGTAKRLQKYGCKHVLCPKGHSNSEAVLAMPELQEVSNKHVVIIRAKEGRELIFNTLRQRGAKTAYLEVYQRLLPNKSTAPLLKRWQQHPFDIVVTTSQEGLKNLCLQLGKTTKQRLGQCRVSAMNKNMLLSLQDLGVEDIIELNSGSNAAILDTIIAYYKA